MWTAERIETAKRLWNAGETASAIAERLGGVTRSAVLGKLNRHGLRRSKDTGPRNRSLKARADRHRAKMAKRAEAKAAAPKPCLPQPPKPEPLPVFEPLIVRKTFAELQDNDCRMPSGDPRHDDFGFCALPKAPGRPYCPDCCRRAYNGVPVKTNHTIVVRGALARLG